MTDPRLELGDPATSAQRLFELAQSNPELGPQIAAHPNAYPGLREWLAQQPAQPTAPLAYTQPTQQLPQQMPQQQPQQPGYGQAPADAWQNGGYAAGYPAYPGAPDTPGYPVGPGAPGAPVHPGGQVPPTGGGGSRKALFIVLAAVLVVALLVTGGIVWWALASKLGGSGSPEAAATKLIDGAASFDPLTLYGSLAPSEISGFTASTERLMEIEISPDQEESLRQTVDRLKNAVSIEVEGIQTETEEIVEGVERVFYIDGTITLDGDEDEVVDALMEFYALSGDLTGSSSRDYRDYLEEGLRDEIDLPYVIDFAELERDLDGPLAVVAVHENGGWYVSPMLSIADAWYRDMEKYDYVGDLGSRIVEGEPSGSPEEAGSALADAVVSGDFEDIAARLPLAERRLLSIYGPPLFEEMDIDGWNRDLELDAAEFSAERDGTNARLNLEDLGVTGMLYSSYGNDELHLRFSDHCLDVEYYDSYWDETEHNSGCLDDLIPRKIYRELGLDQMRIIAVKEGGGWFVSPVATIADINAIVSTRMIELSNEGRLEELFDDLYAY